MTDADVPTADPVRLILQSIRTGDVRSLGLRLKRDVMWTVEGLPPLKGRASLLYFWDRLLPRYEAVQVEPRKVVLDGDTCIADQIHVLRRQDQPPIVLQNIAVYHLSEGRIARWADHLDLSAAPGEEVAYWRRLRQSAGLAG